MRKLFVGIVMLLSAFIAVQAQEASDFEATNNVVKLNFGPGLVFSDIYEYDFPKTICHKTSMSLDLSLGYAHTFNSGLGFGLNFIQSHLNALGKNDYYAGASFYYGTFVNNRWHFDISVGLGYARNDYGEQGSKNGFGLFEQIGAHYKFAKHWGVGADIHLLSCFYKKPDGWDEITDSDTGFGSKRAALTLGLQYFF